MIPMQGNSVAEVANGFEYPFQLIGGAPERPEFISLGAAKRSLLGGGPRQVVGRGN